MKTFLFILTFSLINSVLLAQNKINSRLFYLKPHLYNSKSKVTHFDLSSYVVTVSLPIDDRSKYYGETAYKNKETHEIDDFFGSPAMEEIQNKIKSDLAGFKSKQKNHAQKRMTFNSSVEVFYPKTGGGFINRKSFAKVRLVLGAVADDTVLFNKKYESVYVTNGMDNGFEGDVSMTVEDGENVTLGMALRQALDQFYNDLNQVLSLKKNFVIVYGKVTSAKTGSGVGAAITFRSATLSTANTSPEGNFQLAIPKTRCDIQITAPGFMNYLDEHDIPNTNLKMIEMDFKLRPIETGIVVSLKNVLFQTGTTTLLGESFPELDEAVTFLKDNKKVKIELQGHTDNQGDASKDLILSQQRVEKIKSYLVSQGIKSNRVSGKGFGSTRPIASNASEEGRRLNRRVEFVIVKN